MVAESRLGSTYRSVARDRSTAKEEYVGELVSRSWSALGTSTPERSRRHRQGQLWHRMRKAPFGTHWRSSGLSCLHGASPTPERDLESSCKLGLPTRSRRNSAMLAWTFQIAFRCWRSPMKAAQS